MIRLRHPAPLELHVARVVVVLHAVVAAYVTLWLPNAITAVAVVLLVISVVGMSGGRRWGRGIAFVLEAVLLAWAAVEFGDPSIKIAFVVTAALALPGTFPGFPSRRPRYVAAVPDATLTTERLLLRPLDIATDIPALLSYRSLPNVVRYVPHGPLSREDIVERFQSGVFRSELGEPGSRMTLGIVRRDTGALIGDIMVRWTSAEHRGAEIGYIMHPDHHGQGFATEAGREILRYTFDDLGLHRVIARIDERNEASARVLQRLGMRAEARLVENEWFKGEWTTEIDYALLASEWRAGSQP